ncbi:MAG: ATP-binding protein, partial [Gemmatimonadales bacterium]
MGQPSLLAPSGEPIRFRTKKHLALLIYLAVEGKTQRRERLAELLWPNVTPTEGRHSLATALSTLRPRLGPQGLETSRDHVRLSPERVELDLDRLESGDVLGTEVTGVLEVAAFLDGFDIVDSPEFNHWRDRQQARLLPAIKDALVVLIDRCRRTGDTRQIERLADRMLALDELSEEAIRAKMEARAFAGDRLTALEFFEEWKRKLADELQAAPSDLVEGMAVRLRRRGWERTTSTNIPTVPTDQWRGRPFIGRAVEYQVLYELWEGVQRGEPGHALILGDSGVGKTTLVEKLTTAAGLEGAAISRVQCYDLEREIPYSTVSSLVLGLLDRPGVSATAPESLAELARTVPEVRHRFPNIPASSDSQGEAARIRLTEAFHEMLASVAEEHPVILVVDDLHLADDVSLAVLHLAMRRARGQPIMVLLVARPGELSPSTHAGLLRESATALPFREIKLSPLSNAESRDLLRSLFRSDESQPNTGSQRALLHASAGYPMVLELLVEDWKANGNQSLLLSVDSMTADLNSAGTLPAVYGRILAQAERSLTPTALNVLKLASILGPRLNDLTMYALADLSIAQTASGLAELASRRFLRDSGQGLEFVNELVRTAVYLGIPSTLRKVLHGHIADGFLDQERGAGNALGLEIAWHCMRGGRIDEATIHLLNGAREAVRCGALQAAERALSTAIRQLAGTERTEAILLLLEVLQEQGSWSESLQVLSDTPPEDARDATMVFSLYANHMMVSPTTEQMLHDLRLLYPVVESTTENWIRIRAAKAAATTVAVLRDPALARKLL